MTELEIFFSQLIWSHKRSQGLQQGKNFINTLNEAEIRLNERTVRLMTTSMEPLDLDSRMLYPPNFWLLDK